MATWNEVEAEAPELMALVRGYLDAHKHKTLATLRRDGSPRISGTEIEFARGDVWIGSMWEARKALDLRRDSRFALHSGSDDPPHWEGDAKLGGNAVEVDDEELKGELTSPDQPPGPFHLFRLDLTEVVAIQVEGDHLVIDSWHAGRGVSRMERR